MARGGLSFSLGGPNATFKANADVKAIVTAKTADDVVGLAVTVTGNEEAGLGAAGDPLLGQIVHYETDGHMTVQYAGFAEFNGVSGALPTAGTDFVVVVDGQGAVTTSTGATGPSKVVNVGAEATGPVVVLIG